MGLLFKHILAHSHSSQVNIGVEESERLAHALKTLEVSGQVVQSLIKLTQG